LNIVAQIKSGNEHVFQQVFNEYHEKLYFYVLNKTGSEYMAEEVVQITFIKLWKSKENLNESYSISTQLFRIAKTTLIDLIRKNNTIDSLAKKVEGFQTNLSADDTMEKIDAKELIYKFEKALEKLPPIRRKVFRMSRIEEKSYQEIASELSISTKTVENHISLAIKQLRPYLTVLLIIFLVSYQINNFKVGAIAFSKRIIHVNKVF
jgi:RNA polymerase sigma-70 factor (ECF subfamily)